MDPWAKELIALMLNPDADARASLEEVSWHEWVSIGNEGRPAAGGREGNDGQRMGKVGYESSDEESRESMEEEDEEDDEDALMSGDDEEGGGPDEEAGANIYDEFSISMSIEDFGLKNVKRM